MTKSISVPNFAYAATLVAILFAVGLTPVTGQTTTSGGDGDAHSHGEIAGDSQPTPTIQGQAKLPSLEELKETGRLRSSYLQRNSVNPSSVSASSVPFASVDARAESAVRDFRKEIEPILKKSCVDCHGEDLREGNIRIDTLDPDLYHGQDVDWWLEVLAVLSNGEMPPADEAEMADEERSKVIEWLSAEIQNASIARRAEQPHTSFRRMTRYEYNFAMQDLLGLPFDFSKELPPEATSEDGFQNSSEMLHMSAMQFAAYRESARKALSRAVVRNDRPAPIYWSVLMKDAAAAAWREQEQQLEKIRDNHKDDPQQLEKVLARKRKEFRARPNNAHYKDLTTGHVARVTWRYGGAKYAWKPSATRPELPAISSHVCVIPPKQKLIVELGDTVPDRGTLRVRARAARTSTEDDRLPSLQLEFGWQASNDSSASTRISQQDMVIDAPPDGPRFYQWEIPLSEIYPRNSVRNISQMGDLPSPSEYVKFVNSSVAQGDVQIDYVEITAPVYRKWPPASHVRIFHRSNVADEAKYAAEVIERFMTRAWRRPATESEVEQKLVLFQKVRPVCVDVEEALTEVLASVLSSPKFLYLVSSGPSQTQTHSTVQAKAPVQTQSRLLEPSELATRLSMFLWCSIPDDELRKLAINNQLMESNVLRRQVHRMLDDPRSERFAHQFMRQWLGMELLDYLDVDRKAYPGFDEALKEAMQGEPVAFFQEVLRKNRSVLEFVHSDYTMANERLAQHYGMQDIHGNHFRPVTVAPKLAAVQSRGGLLTQAGLLAMNSDGKDSHPLKRGIWLLESLLNDPPPPPPPAVPEIDLADPEIAKLTLKQRIEDHRNQAACMSCHAKIDPWGIAFENFDAVGRWRTEVQGKPVDANSVLFNGQKLEGMNGLKRFLLEHRQDQFVRALVQKMTTYALGRPLSFGDRSSVDRITADIRSQGDGLASMVETIVTSEIFRTK